MSPEARTRWRAALSAGQIRAWAKPEVHARRTAAIKAAYDDPLLLALARAKRAEEGSVRHRPRLAYNAYYRARRAARRATRFETFDPRWSVPVKEMYFEFLLTKRRAECSQHSF